MAVIFTKVFLVISIYTVYIYKNVFCELTNVCRSEECILLAQRLFIQMNTNVDPCNNFYDFACGNYKYANPIPFFKTKTNTFDERERIVTQKAFEFLKIKDDEAPPAFKKARDLFQSCLKVEYIEKLGDFPIPIMLKTVELPVKPPFDDVTSKSLNFSKTLAKIHKYASTEFLFTLNVSLDERDSKIVCLEIGQISKTISFHEDSENDKTSKNKQEKFNKALKQFMTNVIKYMYDLTYTKFSLNTLNSAEQKINEAIDFLQQTEEIAKKTYFYNKYAHLNLFELQTMTDEILKDSNMKFSWSEYIEVIFEDADSDKKYSMLSEQIQIVNIDQLKDILRYLSTIDNKILTSVMWWLIVNETISFSTHKLKNFQQLFFNHLNIKSVPREEYCIDTVIKSFQFVIAHVLLYDSVLDHRNQVFEMTIHLQNTLTESIINSEWMDDVSKMAALHKLQSIIPYISFSDWLLNVENLNIGYDETVIFKDSFFNTMRRNRKNFDIELSMTLKFAYLNYGELQNPTIVNAAYSPLSNSIVIPIGIIGFPIYGYELQAINYGTLGTLIGHEIIHAFDNIGKQYDSWGNHSNWWKKKTMKNFEGKLNCFVASYNQFYYEDLKKHVNGIQTLSENIADNGGFKQALNAYRKYLKQHDQEPTLIGFENYTHEQLFILAYANLWCENATLEYIEYLIKNDEHAPNSVRVIGTLMNSSEFSKIWNCPSESNMNPTKKCELW